MKKISYYILAAWMCALPLFSSCTDMLEEESSTEVDKNKYMNNASEAENVLLGVYRSMVGDGLYRYNLSILFDITNDLAQCEGNSNNAFREVPSNSFTTSNSDVQKSWSELYSGIFNANDFIETLESKIGNYTDGDKKIAGIYMAEARALRALYYFELVRWYGNIALMTNTEMSRQHPSTFVQADPAAVYRFIEEDLQYAIDNLPYGSDDEIRKNKSFRMSKGAAMGLLTKVYVTWAGYPIRDTSKWEKAALTAQELVESKKHSLLPSYEQLWKNTCNGVWAPEESLIEVSFYAPTVTGSSKEDPVGRIGKWNGVVANEIAGVRGRNAGNVKVVYTFLRDWEKKEDDKRCNLSIADYKYVGNVKTPYSTKGADEDQKNWQLFTPAKWDTEKYVTQSNILINADYSNINWYVLRYADVLLMYAEALNEWKGGPTTEAYAAVNAVRRRGFDLPVDAVSEVADLAPSLSPDDFRTAIRKERAYELAFEGHRRQDLVRWGEYIKAIDETDTKLRRWFSNANYIAYDFTKAGKHELFPIPQRDKDLMTQFKQNPGWN